MNGGAAILKRHKGLLAVFMLLTLATVLLNGWIGLKGRPPANLPIGLGAGDRRASPVPEPQPAELIQLEL